MFMWSFVSLLKAVCRMLSRGNYRTRLIQTCFHTEPQSAYIPDLRGLSHQVYEGRWGTVLAAVSALVPLEHPLTFAWSVSAYRLGGRPMAAESEESAQVGLVDAALTSNLFWSYTHASDFLGECLLSQSIWSEACPCHDEDPRMCGSSRHLRREAFKRLAGKTSCPLRCMRAPELATGSTGRFLERLLSVSNAELLMMPCFLACAPDERAIVSRDFGAAKRYSQFSFSIKLSFWPQLPWRIFGLAHHAPESAAQCAKAIVARAASIDDWSSQHPRTRELLQTSALRRQLGDMADGVSLELLPELKLFVAPFKFAMVSERCI